jgi:class 3 adenylate cyclase
MGTVRDVRIEVQQPRRRPLQVIVNGRLELGRDCDGLLLADARVSRSHVALTPTQRGLEVTDLGSTNGSSLNGRPITEPTLLTDGDQLVLGDTSVRIVGDPSPSSASKDRRTVVGSSAHPPATGDGPSETRVVKGSGASAAGHHTSIDLLATQMQEAGPDLVVPYNDGTVTILFSDIEQSTVLAERLGDARWLTVLHAHNDLVRHLLRDHGGREVKAQGDGFMLTFPSARRGIIFAVSLQRALRLHAHRNPEKAVRVRIGLHTGDAINEAGDIFGRHVILSARIAGVAHGEQILVSTLAFELASSSRDLSFGPEQRVELKGLEGTFGIREVHWREPQVPAAS